VYDAADGGPCTYIVGTGHDHSMTEEGKASTMRQEARAIGASDGARDRPLWTDVLRALREARGVTQNGWATWLGVSRKTVQRWESGLTVPDPVAEEALVEVCRQRGLFRAFDLGPSRHLTLTPELLRDLLAEARLGAASTPLPPAPDWTAQARLIARSGDGRTTTYPLRTPETTIGRGADNGVVVASDHASRYHARVSWDGRQYVVEDLGSKNGTFVDGEAVTGRRPLQHGDVVTLADLTDLALTFDAGGETVTVGREALPAGGLWVDTRAEEVWLRGRALDLPPAEYRALALLYERAGEVVDTATLAVHTWPELGDATSVEAVVHLIGELRQKIELSPATPRFLLSGPGGYRLVIG
jgi:DNA-binding transcriptional regulator YiaG